MSSFQKSILIFIFAVREKLLFVSTSLSSYFDDWLISKMKSKILFKPPPPPPSSSPLPPEPSPPPQINKNKCEGRSPMAQPYSPQPCCDLAKSHPPYLSLFTYSTGMITHLGNFLGGVNEMLCGSTWKLCVHHIIFLPIDHSGIYPLP